MNIKIHIDSNNDNLLVRFNLAFMTHIMTKIKMHGLFHLNIREAKMALALNGSQPFKLNLYLSV